MSVKKLATLFFVLLICAFMRTENVLADECDIVLDHESVGEDLEEEGDIVFDASENMRISKEEISPVLLRTSSYEVVSYSKTYVTGCGDKDEVATIKLTGEVYFYDTGQVHLRSMKVSVDPIWGCDCEISDIYIVNTDGSRSSGSVFVLLEYDGVEVARLITIELKGGSRDININFV